MRQTYALSLTFSEQDCMFATRLKLKMTPSCLVLLLRSLISNTFSQFFRRLQIHICICRYGKAFTIPVTGFGIVIQFEGRARCPVSAPIAASSDGDRPFRIWASAELRIIPNLGTQESCSYGLGGRLYHLDVRVGLH